MEATGPSTSSRSRWRRRSVRKRSPTRRLGQCRGDCGGRGLPEGPHRRTRATAASERSDANKAIRQELVAHFGEQFKPAEIGDALFNVIKKAMRKRILEEGRRADGRATTQIRELDIHVGVLPVRTARACSSAARRRCSRFATLAG